MNSHTTESYRRMLADLPAHVRRQARQAYKLFRQDPSHRSLGFKKVHTVRPIYSARVGIHYRAVGIIEHGEIIWYWIGPHADYDKLLKRL